MSISFRGAKKYKKHNGFDKSAEIHSPLPAPVYFFNLVQNTDVALSPLVEVGDTVEITAGPMEGSVGTVDEIDIPARKVRVRITMFGRELPAELELHQVKLF
mgnify:CR=1 FL=1